MTWNIQSDYLISGSIIMLHWNLFLTLGSYRFYALVEFEPISVDTP